MMAVCKVCKVGKVGGEEEGCFSAWGLIDGVGPSTRSVRALTRGLLFRTCRSKRPRMQPRITATLLSSSAIPALALGIRTVDFMYRYLAIRTGYAGWRGGRIGGRVAGVFHQRILLARGRTPAHRGRRLRNVYEINGIFSTLYHHPDCTKVLPHYPPDCPSTTAGRVEYMFLPSIPPSPAI